MTELWVRGSRFRAITFIVIVGQRLFCVTVVAVPQNAVVACWGSVVA